MWWLWSSGFTCQQFGEVSADESIGKKRLTAAHEDGLQFGQTVEYLQGELGPEAWADGMHPEIPGTQVLDNPYTYKETEAWKTREESDSGG